MPAQEKWQGRSRGGLTGHKIFLFVLRIFGRRAAYLLLRFVAFYFLVTARSTRTSRDYFRQVHGITGFAGWKAAYLNYFLFGQVLIDKVLFMSGQQHVFTTLHDGHQEYLRHLREKKTGGILLSAHVGNWEIAGQKLEKLETQFHVLMFDNEAEHMKKLMEGAMSGRTFNVIAMRPGDLSHLVELHKAFSNREILVMHGDRFLPGAETVTVPFFGRPAKFPAGPFIMASKFSVPITVVFSMKDNDTTYHFYARNPIEVKRARGKKELDSAIEVAAREYVTQLEEMVRKYPLQWFNFYDFWTS